MLNMGGGTNCQFGPSAAPPCQPWSAAGHQAGLSSPDGRWLLLVADIVRTPAACLEMVARFLVHRDFAHIMQTWKNAGCHCIYDQLLQLAEVVPKSPCKPSS